MAVPTVTSITPSSGHTGGRTLIEIIGTGFALPPPPPAKGKVPVPKPSVAVTFTSGAASAEALRVDVVSDTQLFVFSPISPVTILDANDAPKDWGPGTVDITVQNLDADGAAIDGEAITVTDAFTYVRPDLARRTHPTETVAALIQELIRQVTRSVDYAVHTDYAGEDDASQINLAHIPDLPALLIADLDFPASVTQPQGPQAVPMTGDGVWARRREPRKVDAILGLLGLAETVTEIGNLLLCVRMFFQKNPTLRAPRNPYDPTAGTIEYALDFQEGEPIKVSVAGAGGAPNSNLKGFTCACAIRGIVMEDMPGLPEAGVAGTPAGLAHEATTAVTWRAEDVAVTRESNA